MQDSEMVFWIIVAIGFATIPLMVIFDPRGTGRISGKPLSADTPTASKPERAAAARVLAH